MTINGKECGVAYDNLVIIQICKELGLKYLDELQAVYQEAFNSDGRVSIETISLQYAIIYATVNRWCEKNKKEYRIDKDEVVDLENDQLQEILTEIFKFIAENSPEPEKSKKK